MEPAQIRIGEVPGQLFTEIRKISRLTHRQLACMLGTSESQLHKYESGRRPHELTMISMYRQGNLASYVSWNEVATAFGYVLRLRDNNDPHPDDYQTMAMWLTALRLSRERTLSELSTRSGLHKNTIHNAEVGRTRLRLTALRRIRDACELEPERLRDALSRFYVRYEPKPPDDSAEDFWSLIATPVGSPQEKTLADKLYRRHAWIAELVADMHPTEPNAHKIAVSAVKKSMLTHIPTLGGIEGYAISVARGAIRSMD